MKRRGDVSRQFIAGLRSQQQEASASTPAEVPEEASGEVPAEADPAEVPEEASSRSEVPAEAGEVQAEAAWYKKELERKIAIGDLPPIPPWPVGSLPNRDPSKRFIPAEYGLTQGPYTAKNNPEGQVYEVFSHATKRYWNPMTGECWTMVDGQKVIGNLG